MCNFLRLPGLLTAALLVAATVRADPPQAEIVVSMRYLQQTGTSHAHLYLYLADGKLLRQLTDDGKSQDSNPFFAPNGETIVFTRKPDAGGTEFYSIEPHGGNLRKLPAAPDWYAHTKDSPYFGGLSDDPDGDQLYPDNDVPKRGSPPAYRSPDGSAELVLKTGGKDDNLDGDHHGHLYLLRDLKGGKEVVLGKLPGFEALVDLWALAQDKDQRFLLAPPLRVAFFGRHLDSTDGSTVYALDLTGKRLVRLSPNDAAPYPLPGEPAFLTLTENRYVPFGDGKRTANCSYVERWDSDLKVVRYANGKAAGNCYGASMYRPGKSPAVICIQFTEP